MYVTKSKQMTSKQVTLIAMILALFGLPSLPALAQICNGNMQATAPDNRYTDNEDGTVTDQRTQLMWKQCSEGRSTTVSACDTGTATSYIWQDALQQAQTINRDGFAGYQDWRVPNINELASLVEFKCYQPSINESLLPVLGAGYWGPGIFTPGHWSSTPEVSYRANALQVEFEYGGFRRLNKNFILSSFVRLVRNTL